MAVVSFQEHLFPIVLFLFSLVIGIELTLGQFKALLRRPRIPILGTLIHTVTFPVIAVLMVVFIKVAGVDLPEATLLGMLLVAACPSGGFSNMLVLLARADLALSVLLTAVSSVLSFASVPLFFWLFGFVMPELSGDVQLPIGTTLATLLMMVVVPVGVGMVWRAYQADYVVPRIKRFQNIAQVALYAVIVGILVEEWDTLGGGIESTLPWALLMCVLALAAGFFISRLAGLSPVDSATVAIEGSIRNLGVAFLIATTVLGRVDIAVMPSVYFGAVLLVGLTFSRIWRVRFAPRYREQHEV